MTLKFILAVLLIGYLPCLLAVMRVMGTRTAFHEDAITAFILALLFLLPAYGIRLLVGL